MSDLKMANCPNCRTQFVHDGSIAGRVISCPSCSADLTVPIDPRQRDHQPRVLFDEGLALAGEIRGQAPVQAEGHVRGHPFYFRAKWTHWTFTACVSAAIDASCIDPPIDKDGFFHDGEYRGFYLNGAYPEASFMPFEDAETIIRQCSRRLLDALDAESGDAPEAAGN